MSSFEKRHAKMENKKGVAMEEMAKLDVPTGDDFFDTEVKPAAKQPGSTETDSSKQQFFI